MRPAPGPMAMVFLAACRFQAAGKGDDSVAVVDSETREEPDPVDTSCGVETIWYADVDADGYGDPEVTEYACDAPLGYVAGAGDCGDTDSSVHPGAEDIAWNGRDEDCDGVDACGRMYVGNLDLDGLGETEMMAFCADYDGVSGDVSVREVTTSDLTALSCLCGVSGTITVEENTILTSTLGLSNLRYVGGALLLWNNPPTALDGLVNLSWVGSSLSVQWGVADTWGLSSLTSVGSSMSLSGVENGGLKGLTHLVSAGDGIYLSAGFLDSLEGLEGLRNLGRLTIEYGNFITTLAPLSNLRTLSGPLWINGARSLQTLDGLQNVTQLERLTIQGAAVLTDLDGLSAVQVVEDGFIVTGNPLLTRVALPALTDIGGEITLENLPALSSLDGLALPDSYGWSVSLVDVGLTRIDALTNLQIVHGFEVTGTQLVDFSGMENLAVIYGDLVITDNLLLDDVSALEGIRRVSGSLIITGNSSLGHTRALELRNAIGDENVGGDVIVEQNGP